MIVTGTEVVKDLGKEMGTGMSWLGCVALGNVSKFPALGQRQFGKANILQLKACGQLLVPSRLSPASGNKEQDPRGPRSNLYGDSVSFMTCRLNDSCANCPSLVA